MFSYGRLAKITANLNIPLPDTGTHQPVKVGEKPSVKKRKISENDIDLDGNGIHVLPNGLIPVNPEILKLTDIVKPYIRELVEHANVVKMWITFNIPRIEDGNNFGVSVQEDTLAEARQVESEAASYMDQITRYYISRGKLLSKVAKYPHLEDYRHVIAELDRKEFMSLRLVVAELRNNYCALHDVILKNLDKIKKPRTSNTENMF